MTAETRDAPRSRPVLCRDHEVRGILDGSLTQLRRAAHVSPSVRGVPEPVDGSTPDICGDETWHFRRPDGRCEWHTDCPFGKPGDRLWVRETFYCDHYKYPDAPVEEMTPLIEYRADHDCRNWEAGCPCSDDEGRSAWRPSIHMPRWASRLTLEVTDVRVERLQDISEADANAEGVDELDGSFDDAELCLLAKCMGEPPESARVWFAHLWDTINAKRGYSWASNPWVWVVGFRRVA